MRGVGLGSPLLVALALYALLSTTVNLYMITQQRHTATCNTRHHQLKNVLGGATPDTTTRSRTNTHQRVEATDPDTDFPFAHKVATGPIAAAVAEAQRSSVTSGYGPMHIPDWVLQQDIYNPKSDIYFGDEAVNGSFTYREHYEVCIYQCDNRVHKMGRSQNDIFHAARINNYMYARNWGYKYTFCSVAPPLPWSMMYSKPYFHTYYPSAKLCDYIIFLDSDAFFSHHDMSLQTFFATYAPTFPHDKHIIITSADGAYWHGPNAGVFIVKNTLRVPQPPHNYTRGAIHSDHTRQTTWTQNVPDPDNPGKTKAQHFPEKIIGPPTHHYHPGGFSNMTWEFMDDYFHLPARVEHYAWAYTAGHQDNVALTAICEHIYYDHWIKLPDDVLHVNGQYIQHSSKEGWNGALQVLTHGGLMRTQARQSMALLHGQCTVEDYFQHHRLLRICHQHARDTPLYRPLAALRYVQAQQHLLHAFTPDYVPQQPLP